jgi:Cu2+-exporting ATPase
VAIAIGGGTDAIESAGIILVNSNPLDVVKIFKLSRASSRKMTQNLWGAAGYNIFAIPLAADILADWGILLSPAVGALLMSVNTIVWLQLTPSFYEELRYRILSYMKHLGTK